MKRKPRVHAPRQSPMHHARVQEEIAKSQFSLKDSGFQMTKPRICAVLKCFTLSTTLTWQGGVATHIWAQSQYNALSTASCRLVKFCLTSPTVPTPTPCRSRFRVQASGFRVQGLGLVKGWLLCLSWRRPLSLAIGSTI